DDGLADAVLRIPGQVADQDDDDGPAEGRHDVPVGNVDVGDCALRNRHVQVVEREDHSGGEDGHDGPDELAVFLAAVVDAGHQGDDAGNDGDVDEPEGDPAVPDAVERPLARSGNDIEREADAGQRAPAPENRVGVD